MREAAARGRRSYVRADKRCNERGACGLKAILWLAILGSFVYVCFKAGPHFVNEYQFQDAMQTLARFASVNRQSPDDIRAALMKEAEKDNIPIRPQDIKITARDGNVKIDVDYSVIVDLQVYQWKIDFHPSANNYAL